MANILDRNTDFLTNGTVTSAGLHNLIDDTNIYAGLISTQAEKTTVGTADLVLVADSSSIGSPQIAANRTTVYNLFEDALTGGTYVNANFSANLTYGTATGNRTVSTSATITTGTIPNLTAGTTTSTAATITNGTITTALIPTLTAGTTTGTAGIFTSGTVATINSTTGTIATLNSTTGTIATLNSTTGTITNLSTTLAGDFTISQGTGTIGTAKITPEKLLQPFTREAVVASTSGTAIDFTGIPSWARRITVILNEIATSTNIIIQIGDSGGIETTGYISTSNIFDQVGLSTGITSTAGFAFLSATNTSGVVNILNITGDAWIATHSGKNNTTQIPVGGGSKGLSTTLDRVRILSDGGTFSAGSINIIYEG
jgi:hypothetical protein